MSIIASIRSLLPSFKIKTFDEDTGYGLLRHVMVRVAHATGQIYGGACAGISYFAVEE